MSKNEIESTMYERVETVILTSHSVQYNCSIYWNSQVPGTPFLGQNCEMQKYHCRSPQFKTVDPKNRSDSTELKVVGPKDLKLFSSNDT